jgi:hypothetical protein
VECAKANLRQKQPSQRVSLNDRDWAECGLTALRHKRQKSGHFPAVPPLCTRSNRPAAQALDRNWLGVRSTAPFKSVGRGRLKFVIVRAYVRVDQSPSFPLRCPIIIREAYIEGERLPGRLASRTICSTKP